MIVADSRGGGCGSRRRVLRLRVAGASAYDPPETGGLALDLNRLRFRRVNIP